MSFCIDIPSASNQILLGMRGRQLRKLHHQALISAFHEIGIDVLIKTQSLIERPPKTGRIYNFQGRKHQASAPGEAPANRTGRLAVSGDFKVRNHREMVIGEEAFYAGWLENGTSKMAPRPHLIRAIRTRAYHHVSTILKHIDEQVSE